MSESTRTLEELVIIFSHHFISLMIKFEGHFVKWQAWVCQFRQPFACTKSCRISKIAVSSLLDEFSNSSGLVFIALTCLIYKKNL